ncbi:MAG: RNA 3'-terminal phosphate cyclase [Fimbriiglobus sp.]|jgi:RNA 3'-terminal phosphate cyclase (ATP)|nr:RNA 3'-terminal phosphate cyclase [Fimbriiglobus sp.]
MIEIDGSEGEGGGQILRSALALSVITGQPFKLINIRARRSKPGLAPQHLACVKAAGNIASALYKGGQIGSAVLYFEPGTCKAGTYFFGVNTAGATALILHSVYLPLALCGRGESTLTITGGTHVAHAPCYHFLETTWAAYLRRMGIEVELEMAKPGFYPRGGGELRATIRPCAAVRPLNLTTCPELTTAGGFAAVADLPASISKTMSRRMAHQLKKMNVESHLPQEEWANGPAAVAAVLFRQAPVPPLFFALGERGKPAEVVADEATEQAIDFKKSGCPVDPHSADQIVLPLAFAAGPSEFRVSEVTQHLLTNIDTIRRFVDRPISCDGSVGTSGTVRVE